MIIWFKNKKNVELLNGLILLYLYFFALDVSYIHILGDKVEPFILDINIFNICLGLIVITLLYVCWHRLDCRKPSVFLFGIVFLSMYVPIVAIYGMMKYDGMYLLILTACMIITIFLMSFENRIIFKIINYRVVQNIVGMDKLIPLALGILTVIFVLLLILIKGFPTFTALNIYDVYKIRLDSYFIKNRYMNYLFIWICRIVLPFLISLFLIKGRFLLTILFSIIDLIFYLYSGEKVILFTLIIIYGIFLLISLKLDGPKILYVIMTGLAFMCFSGMMGFDALYDILIRRTLFLPAHLKFLYYEFFSNHPKIGIEGTLWGSIFGVPIQYSDGIGKTISQFFFNNDAMNANTGFMAEGYYRFGFIGLILVFLLLYLLLKLIDYLSIKTSRNFAIMFSICPIYMLNDGTIIDSIIFGPLLLFIVICLFYYDNDMRDKDMNDVNYVREIKFTRVIAAIFKRKIAIVTIFTTVVVIVCSMHYFMGRTVKFEKPCYTYYLEAYFDYDFETDSIMNYAEILDEESMVRDVAEYVGLKSLNYNKVDNSIKISPRAKRIIAISIIGKDKNTVNKIAQGYKHYALPKLRDNIGAKEIEIINSSNQGNKIKINGYTNDGKPGLIKMNKSIETENWDEYLYHKTNFLYFAKQGIVAGLLTVIIFILIIVLKTMYDKKIRSPRDIKNCIGEDVIAVIDKEGKGIDYMIKRLESLPISRTSYNSLLIVPIKIPTKLLDNLRQKNTESAFKITNNVDEKADFLDDVFNGAHVVIGIGNDCLTDIELININEVLVTAGAEIVGVVIFGVGENEIRKSDEYFGKYFVA